MIVRDLLPGTALFRVLTPSWAWAPTSGDGAALRGGRFNRPHEPAVYLSLDAVTALIEYRGTSSFLPPGTIASYEASARLVDLTRSGPGDPDWDATWAAWSDDWRHEWFDLHQVPKTWVIGDRVLATPGVHGIVFPSTRHHGGVNVVLYSRKLTGAASLKCLDPQSLLPRNQASWW